MHCQQKEICLCAWVSMLLLGHHLRLAHQPTRRPAAQSEATLPRLPVLLCLKRLLAFVACTELLTPALPGGRRCRSQSITAWRHDRHMSLCASVQPAFSSQVCAKAAAASTPSPQHSSRRPRAHLQHRVGVREHGELGDAGRQVGRDGLHLRQAQPRLVADLVLKQRQECAHVRPVAPWPAHHLRRRGRSFLGFWGGLKQADHKG